MLNLSPAVIFFSRTITLRSRQAGTWIDGRFIPGALVDSSIKATVQPSTARDLEILPEAERKKQTLTVWTTIEIKISGDSSQTDSDILLIDSKQYKAIHAYNRSLDGNYFKTLIELLQ